MVESVNAFIVSRFEGEVPARGLGFLFGKRLEAELFARGVTPDELN